ncbi:P-loop containing nucleoside triphosphate hydrolase protein [Schizopora paradoxa]|uniref:p-loop containing nucleoside triphosphate hydrolase protein n=1 Tax=Schizopora paradoxa TaxID=27342 RepID=A0A0H2S4N3_9AGAM|nr:P-loop containing nucleoside triphosphate hydrolase protein [Schizopora paradoxa]
MTIDLSESEYAKNTRSILDVAKSLRESGVSTTTLKITIPLLVIIGSQSAGKSSIVEVISGVRVPRASGTCTRCPMEVNIRRCSGEWSVQVYLRREFDAAGVKLDVATKVPFGEPIADRKDISRRLMCAQIAILDNAEENCEMFFRLADTEIEKYRKSTNGTPRFSKNAIIVDVSDPSPNCIDLSFVDLPGLIQNEAEEVVELLERLVESFINKPDCLILVAVPMSDDIENHKSMRLALKADPEKRRTIGVLTKPDLLSVGSRKKWMEILDGTNDMHALRLGYFIVKLSEDAEKSPPRERDEHESKEGDFFTNNPPWDQYQNRDQLGVKNLVKALSKNLMNLIDDALPRLFESVKEQSRSFRQELSLIPKPIAEDTPSLVVSKRIGMLYKDLERTIAGVDVNGKSIAAGDRSFVQQNQSTYFSLKKAIHSTAPVFRPKNGLSDGSTPESNDAEEYFDEENEVLDVGITLPGPPSTKDCGAVRDYINGSRGHEQKGIVPYTAHRVLIEEFVELWRLPTMQCFDIVSARLEKVLNEHVAKNFSLFPSLCEHILPITAKLFENQRDAAQKAVEVALRMESESPYSPFTQNNEYRFSSMKRWATHYAKVFSQRPASQEYIIPEVVTSIAEQVVESIPVVGEVINKVAEGALASDGSSSDASQTSTKPDVGAYEEERKVMAFVRAYFNVSYKRIIDYIPLTIEYTLNKGLLETIQHGIEENLKLYDPGMADKISAMLCEAKEVKERREYLKDKLALLDKNLLQMRQLGLK